MIANQGSFLEDAVNVYMKEIGVTHLPFKPSPYHAESGDSPAVDSTTIGQEPSLPEGLQSKTCASHLMKLLYAARQTRPDLTTAIVRLASAISKWNVIHDKELRHLIAHHTHDELTFEFSHADLDHACVVLWVDSDWAGDKAHTKSTSGFCHRD